MFARLRDFEPDLLACAALAAALTCVAYLLQAHVGLAPQDEGYLWYGVEAVVRGEWPLRDFRSYDPGRYLWCAAFEHVFGGGILVLRAACASFAAIGLTAGLLVLRRCTRTWFATISGGLLLLAWQFPSWRSFDAALALVAVYTAARLAERPSARRTFAAGVLVGLAAFFGRNHGLYLGVAFVGVLVLGGAREGRTPGLRGPAALVGGTLLGYAPMFAAIAVVPGFARAFYESILFYVGRSSLNVPFPATWPWTVDAERLQGVELVSAYALSAVFVLFVVGYAALGFVVLRDRIRRASPTPELVAALCVGLPYVHLVAERSDIYHVAVTVAPLLLGVVALACEFQRARGASSAPGRSFGAVTLVVLFAISVFAIGTQQPLGRRLAARGSPREYVAFDARGSTLEVDAQVAQRLDAVRARIEREVPSGEPILLGSKLLALYPLLGRKAPVWDVYPLWPADDEAQQRMLDELSSVRWVFLQDLGVGGVEERRFANTHPKVWRRLEQDFDRVPTPELPDNFLFLRRR